MKYILIVIAALVIALPVLPRPAEAACCSANSYYNWGQVYRQNNAARLRGIQQQQRVCASIRAAGRVQLPPACR